MIDQSSMRWKKNTMTDPSSLPEQGTQLVSSVLCVLFPSPCCTQNLTMYPQTNDSALALDHFPSYPSAPLHSLGVSDSPASSRSASLELPSQTTYPFLGDGATSQHHLHRASSSSKARQHDAGRVSHLEDRVEESMELGKLEAREKRMEKSLDEGIEGHREAEDWELLLNGDDDDGHVGGK
jgi:hypothetical protein